VPDHHPTAEKKDAVRVDTVLVVASVERIPGLPVASLLVAALVGHPEPSS
jgi:hypothetical protein